MPASADERTALKNRVLPHMVLSTGDAYSMTSPPAPTPYQLTSDGRASERFAVEGNAIITGGAGTLALVNARALLEHGLSGLALLDLHPSHASSEVDALRKDFPQSQIITKQVDVTNAEQAGATIMAATEQLGGVNILCCFAGVVGCRNAIEMTPQEWKRTFDVNTSGAFFCAQAMAKYIDPIHLRVFSPTAYPLLSYRQLITSQKPGSIVLIASISAHRTNYPQPQSAYNASKAALISIKASLAAEWARYGIRVNTISPGYMDTILNEGEGLEDARRTWIERNPMGRMGQPEELTGPLVMLCSRAGSYLTGADLVVDGGQTVF